LDILESNVCDRDSVGGVTSGLAVLVILLNNKTLLNNLVKSDVLKANVVDLTGSTIDSLNTDTIIRVDNLRVLDQDIVNNVVAAATDGTDGKTMATRAETVKELDTVTRVDSNTVILVVDDSTVNGDVGTSTNVEGVSVVTTLGVTGLVVKEDVVEVNLLGTRDTEGLNRSVVDLETLNLGVLEAMSSEELRLLLTAVASLAVPPTGTSAINLSTGVLLDSDSVTRNLNKGTNPLLVAKGGGTVKDNSGTLVKVGKIKGLTSGNSNVLKNNGRARLLTRNGLVSSGESTRSTSVKVNLRLSRGSNCQSGCHRKQNRLGKQHGFNTLGKKKKGLICSTDCKMKRRVVDGKSKNEQDFMAIPLLLYTRF